jgi:hypothetical protein
MAFVALLVNKRPGSDHFPVSQAIYASVVVGPAPPVPLKCTWQVVRHEILLDSDYHNFCSTPNVPIGAPFGPTCCHSSALPCSGPSARPAPLSTPSGLVNFR